MEVGWSGQFGWPMRSRMHPVRGAGLGRKERVGRVSQAVRPAGKRLRDDDPAEVFVVDNHGFTGGLALGMEAEMDGGLWVSESPLAPLKGGDQQVPWPILPDIVADSPTARRRMTGWRA